MGVATRPLPFGGLGEGARRGIARPVEYERSIDSRYPNNKKSRGEWSVVSDRVMKHAWSSNIMVSDHLLNSADDIA